MVVVEGHECIFVVGGEVEMVWNELFLATRPEMREVYPLVDHITMFLWPNNNQQPHPSYPLNPYPSLPFRNTLSYKSSLHFPAPALSSRMSVSSFTLPTPTDFIRE